MARWVVTLAKISAGNKNESCPKMGLQYYKKMLFKKFKYLIMNMVKYNKKFIFFKYKY